jgi:hypothetical protein
MLVDGGRTINLQRDDPLKMGEEAIGVAKWLVGIDTGGPTGTQYPSPLQHLP